MSTTRVALFALAVSVTGCSWTRFDDVSDGTPVVMLTKPGKMSSGFGNSLASITVPDRDNTRVLVAGSPGLTSPAAAFDIGFGTSPGVDAADTGFCADAVVPCYLSAQPAGLGRADVGGTEDGEQCFILGAGKADGFDEFGLFGRCSGGTEYSLPVPNAVLKRVIDDELIDQRESARAPIRLAADRDEAAALIAGAEEQTLAWYYRPMSTDPIALVPPGKADETFGASTAVLRFEPGSQSGARLGVVGAPKVGHVWLFEGNTGLPVGCLGGTAGFGKALATGNVDNDGVDDLVVADDATVTVFSGKALQGLTPSEDIECSLFALPEGAILASFGCGSRDAAAGCPGGFGAALDVGDLDGDGDGEVIVGAPGMSVRGTGSAGAVLLYDAEGDHPEELADVLYSASREDNDQLGYSVLAAPTKDRDYVVAGLPGSGRTAIFYCSSFVEPGEGRCE